jgi:hypothetical protein
MARQPYMGLSLLFPRLLGLVHLWQLVGDRPTGRAFQLNPDVTASGRQSGDLGEKWALNFAYVHYWFYSCLKNPSTSVWIKPANLGSSGEHANH